MPEPLPPNMERLEFDRQTANGSMARPKDLSWPKYTPAPRTKTLREIMEADWFFGFWMRYEAAQEKNNAKVQNEKLSQTTD